MKRCSTKIIQHRAHYDSKLPERDKDLKKMLPQGVPAKKDLLTSLPVVASSHELQANTVALNWTFRIYSTEYHSYYITNRVRADSVESRRFPSTGHENLQDSIIRSAAWEDEQQY
jgi:hypothetical protein